MPRKFRQKFILVTQIASISLLQAWKCPRIVFSQGFAPDPTGGAYSAPPGPLAGGEGASRPFSKHPTPPQPFGPVCLVQQKNPPPKINPSYGLVRGGHDAGIAAARGNSYHE